MLRVIEKIYRHAGTTTIAALLIAGAWGVNSFASAAEPERKFTLVAVNQGPVIDGVKHGLIISGHGTFTSESVTASGVYQHLDGATKIPKKILGAGTWKATKVLRWTVAKGGVTYGKIHPGVVDLLVDLVPDQGPVIKGATLRINCNTRPAGIKNNDPDTGKPLAEGYWLSIPGRAQGTAFYGAKTAVGPFVPRKRITGITIIYK